MKKVVFFDKIYLKNVADFIKLLYLCSVKRKGNPKTLKRVGKTKNLKTNETGNFI